MEHVSNFLIALSLGASYGVVFYVAGVILIDRAWSRATTEAAS